MKTKETLEEVAERYYEDEVSINTFINGAKWQSERMYSEEEVSGSDLLINLIKLNKKAIKENWKIKDVGFEFFKVFAYSNKPI